MKKKNLAIGSGLVAAGLIAGSMFAPVGFAGAQETEPETDPGTEAPEAESTESEGRRGNRGARAEALADILGITTDELKASMQEGNTLAEIAAAQGISEADLISQLVAASSARLDEKVAAGDLTAEEAAEKKAGLQERVTNAVNADPSERKGNRRGNRGEKAEALGEALGLSVEELREGFAAGNSIADMAVAQGLDVDDVVDELVANAMERVDAALAEGKIDADRAAEITEGLEEKITERVNADPSERSERGRGGNRGAAADDDSTETGLDA